MKKLMFVAIAALSTAVFADMPATKEIAATAKGYYDVTLTTKHLAHAEKTVSKSFSTKRNATAYDQFIAYCEDEKVTDLPGFTVIDLNGKVTIDVTKEELDVKKITFKYSYFESDKYGNMKTKVVSKSSKGLYDAKGGKVYLWDTADKVSVQYGDTDAIVESNPDRYGKEKDQKGYKAYEVPLAMHKQFVATDDGKTAGGFTGSTATATDGTSLDFAGLTAFGTGTVGSDDILKTVAGNVAGKYPNDIKYGCYGTWKLNLDSKSDKYKSIKDALLAKKCVELVNERD